MIQLHHTNEFVRKMSKPTLLKDLPIEQLKVLTETEILTAIEKEKIYFDSLPQKRYPIALDGAKTKKGGTVKAPFDLVKVKGLNIALVGDDVVYEDGTTAKIISGSGSAMRVIGKGIALVGSHISNDDEIISTPNEVMQIRIFDGEPKPKNFLEPESE